MAKVWSDSARGKRTHTAHQMSRRDYIRINSSLGEATPMNIIVLPVLFEGQVKAVIELGSFSSFSEVHLRSWISSSSRWESCSTRLQPRCERKQLLKQSQALTEELRRATDG